MRRPCRKVQAAQVVCRRARPQQMHVSRHVQRPAKCNTGRKFAV